MASSEQDIRKDFASDLSGMPGELWDSDSAEALMQLYERQVPDALQRATSHMPSTRPLSQHTYDSHAPDQRSMLSMVAPTPVTAPDAADKDWLATRFTEITERFEKSVAAASSEQSLNILSERLDQLEKQFETAIEKFSTRSDADSLRLIEAHVTELSSQITETQKQLVRLGTIEEHLHDLTAYAAATSSSGDNVNKAAPTAVELPDWDVISDSTADRVLSRLAGMPAKPAAEVDAIEQTQSALLAFIDEYRRESSTAAGALDTMQEALIRLIDRVDALHVMVASPLAPSAPDTLQSANSPAAAVPEPESAVTFDLDQFAPAPIPFANPPKLVLSAEPEQANPRPLTPSVESVALAAAAATGDPAIPAETTASMTKSDADDVPAPEKTRKDLEASAMRAKMRAASSANTPTQQRNDKERPQGQAARNPRPPEPARAVSGASRRILAIAFFGMAMIGLGYFGWRMHEEGAFRRLSSKFDDKIASVDATAQASPDRNQIAGADASSTKDEQRIVQMRPSAGSQRLPQNPDVAPAETQPTVPFPSTNATSAGGMPLGISVQHGPVPSRPEDLTAIQQQQMMAANSTRIGAQGAKPAEAFGASAIPAALSPNSQAKPLEAQPPVTTELPGGNAVEMPPATIGPLSLRIAATRGDPGAEFEVAARFAEGKGVKQDFKQAMAWFQRSANHGLAPAQYRLGTLYERGLGEKVDLQRARIWYKRAADQGNIKAMHNLAVLSAGRESGKPDYATAAHWFTQAAERGLADSQFNLGVLYENGLGIPQDYQQAYKWYALAVRGGDKEAAKRRDLLATKLDQASFTSAEQLVTAWQAKRADLPANDPRVGAEALRARSIQGAAPTGAAPAVVPAPKPTSAN